MNILDIAIAKKLAGGGGGSGTDNYNDLSNLPKINDTTLSGNKSSSALGLQSEINSESKLASDLVDDTNQDNKFVTSTEKNTWNEKQNAIDADHKINADYVDDSTSTNKFVTASDKETWNAKQNAIDNSHKLSSDLVDDANHTNKFVTSTEKQTWNAKQNAIDADHKLSSSLVSFSTAEAAALASGINSSKVDQISTNQTNILYTLNKVGTNYVYDYEHGMATPTTMSGVTFTWLDNGKLSIQSNGTNTSDVYYNLEVDVGSRYVGKTMSFVGGVASKCAFYISNSSGAVAISTTSADVTIPSDAVNKLFIAVFANAGAFDITVEPMIRDSNITSNTYSAPALPNYDLTRLESEDRASLAEVVDSGAKNIIDVNNYSNLDNVTISNGVFTTQGDTLTTLRFDVYLRNGSTQLLKVVSAQVISSNGIYYWEFTAPTNTNNVLIGHNGGTYNGRATINLTNLVAGQRYVIQVNVTQCQNASGAFKWQDVMICTKAAFGVSNKFVPYCRIPKVIADLYKEIVGSTTLTDTGLEYYLESGAKYRITAFAEYGASNPLEIVICQSNGVVLGQESTSPASGTTIGYVVATGYVHARTARTITLKARFASATSNYVGMIIEKI